MTSGPLASWLNRARLDALVDDARDGLVATYHPSGQLASLACHPDGARAWALHLEDGVEAGRAVLEQGSGDTADWEVYRDGCHERFDAWSDNSRPRPCAYETWVQRWITEIADTARRRAERARRLARARDALPVRDDDES